MPSRTPPDQMMNPQVPRRRFYIGSAAGFWFFVALSIWLLFLIVFRYEIKGGIRGKWFLASYISSPALLTALLAVLIRNLSANGVPAWLITPPVFVFVGYIMLRYLRVLGGH
jgi:hypothetical protein